MAISFLFQENNGPCVILKVSSEKNLYIFKEEYLEKKGKEEREYLKDDLHLYYNMCQNPSNSPIIKELKRTIYVKAYLGDFGHIVIIKMNFID